MRRKKIPLFKPFIGLAHKPSHFAKFCMDYGLVMESHFLDLVGDKDSEDLKYFSSMGLNVYMIDHSQKTKDRGVEGKENEGRNGDCSCDDNRNVSEMDHGNSLNKIRIVEPHILKEPTLYPTFGTIYAKGIECLKITHEFCNSCLQLLNEGGLLCLETKLECMEEKNLLANLEDHRFQIVYCDRVNENGIEMVRIIGQKPYYN